MGRAATHGAPAGTGPDPEAGLGIAAPVPELHWRFDDAPGRPLMVVLNGLFQRSGHWNPFVAALDGVAVLRYDMRGQGRSPAPPGVYAPEVHAADLRLLLDRLHPDITDRPLVLLGLSNGGIVAQHLLLDPPPGVAAAILVSTTPRLDDALRASLLGWRRTLDTGGVSALVRESTPLAYGRTFLAAHPEVTSEDAIQEAVGFHPGESASRSLLDGILEHRDLRKALGAVDVPSVVITGTEDVLFPPRYSAELAAALQSSELVEMPDRGHTIPVEDPTGLAALVRDRLEGLGVTRA